MEGTVDQIYSKPVPIYIRNNTNCSKSPKSTSSLDSSSYNQQFPHSIQVTLSIKCNGRLKVLEVQLTDEADLYFLYQLDIGEDDFHHLKNDQNLLVDFQQFPQKFIELLEECIVNKDKEAPKFIAKLSTESNGQYAIFTVVETNSFKHITHLSLNFIPGSDFTIKKYLSELVKKFKFKSNTLSEKLETTVSELQDKLHYAENTISAIKSENDRLKYSTSEEMNKVQLYHAEELAREREKALRELEREKTSLEREMHEKELKYEEELKLLTQKFTSTSTSHSHLLHRAEVAEDSLMETRKQLEKMTNDLYSKNHELSQLTICKKQMESQILELQRDVESMKFQLKEKEKREYELTESELRFKEHLASTKEQERKWIESNDFLKMQNMKLEESFQKSTEEIKKGNEIIQKLQSELRNVKSKMKLKNIVTLQQEKLLDERATIIEAKQTELVKLKEDLEKNEEQRHDNLKKIEELSKKLEESKHIIEDNGNVIEWLHKQLNEDAMGKNSIIGGGAMGGMVGRGTFSGIDFNKYTTLDSRRQGGYTSYKSRFADPITRKTSPVPSENPSQRIPQRSTPPLRSSSPTKPFRTSPVQQSNYKMSSLLGSSNLKTSSHLEGQNRKDVRNQSDTPPGNELMASSVLVKSAISNPGTRLPLKSMYRIPTNVQPSSTKPNSGASSYFASTIASATTT